eukprot:8028030-Alexandrium_andersonii.AAC.1
MEYNRLWTPHSRPDSLHLSTQRCCLDFPRARLSAARSAMGQPGLHSWQRMGTGALFAASCACREG